MPEFIGARPGDLKEPMAGMLDANDRMSVDAVLQAAATAFGFVYIHPFQNGNGRLHRCLVHHVLAERKFTPPGIVFPVSSVMYDRIDEYRKTLQSHSGPLMWNRGRGCQQDQFVWAASRSCSRNQACAGSFVSRGCQTMK